MGALEWTGSTMGRDLKGRLVAERFVTNDWS
jgi:hypothetical protein